MRLADAPPPGWYPDPEGQRRLRWWEGTDWTDELRALPTDAELESGRVGATQPLLPHPLPEAPSPPDKQRISRADSEEMVTQFRDAAREELDRAADLFTRSARATLEQGRSAFAEYFQPILRWARILVVAAAVVVIVFFVLQFIAQVSFFDWIGDRIDNVTDN